MESKVSHAHENREIIAYRETFEGRIADGSAYTMLIYNGIDADLDAPLNKRNPVLVSCKIEGAAGKLLDSIKILASDDGGYRRLNDNKQAQVAFDLLPDTVKCCLPL